MCFGIAVNYAFANIPSLNSTNALIGVVDTFSRCILILAAMAIWPWAWG